MGDPKEVIEDIRQSAESTPWTLWRFLDEWGTPFVLIDQQIFVNIL
jgi:hypothetical protein